MRHLVPSRGVNSAVEAASPHSIDAALTHGSPKNLDAARNAESQRQSSVIGARHSRSSDHPSPRDVTRSCDRTAATKIINSHTNDAAACGPPVLDMALAADGARLAAEIIGRGQDRAWAASQSTRTP